MEQVSSSSEEKLSSAQTLISIFQVNQIYLLFCGKRHIQSNYIQQTWCTRGSFETDKKLQSSYKPVKPSHASTDVARTLTFLEIISLHWYNLKSI